MEFNLMTAILACEYEMITAEYTRISERIALARKNGNSIGLLDSVFEQCKAWNSSLKLYRDTVEIGTQDLSENISWVSTAPLTQRALELLSPEVGKAVKAIILSNKYTQEFGNTDSPYFLSYGTLSKALPKAAAFALWGTF